MNDVQISMAPIEVRSAAGTKIGHARPVTSTRYDSRHAPRPSTLVGCAAAAMRLYFTATRGPAQAARSGLVLRELAQRLDDPAELRDAGRLEVVGQADARHVGAGQEL